MLLTGYVWFAPSRDVTLCVCTRCEVVSVFISMHCEALQDVMSLMPREILLALFQRNLILWILQGLYNTHTHIYKYYISAVTKCHNNMPSDIYILWAKWLSFRNELLIWSIKQAACVSVPPAWARQGIHSLLTQSLINTLNINTSGHSQKEM